MGVLALFDHLVGELLKVKFREAIAVNPNAPNREIAQDEDRPRCDNTRE